MSREAAGEEEVLFCTFSIQLFPKFSIHLIVKKLAEKVTFTQTNLEKVTKFRLLLIKDDLKAKIYTCYFCLSII